MRIERAVPHPLVLTARADAAAAVGLGLLLGGGVAASDGGYFPETWAWTAALTFVPAAMLLIAGVGARLRRLDVVFLVLLAAFGGWVLLSALWSPSTTSAVFEAQRVLAYLGVALLVLLVVHRGTAPALLAGCLGGVSLVAGYALLTRLLPDRVGAFDAISGYRLSEPIGYWNGLGVYAAMGALLSIGLLARSERAAAKVAAAATPVVLVTTLYFTFSRGAWLALALGFLVAVAFDPSRLRLVIVALIVAPWCALAVGVASRANALTTRGATLSDARAQGRDVLLVIALLVAASGLSGLALALADRRVRPSVWARRAFAGALVAVVLAGVATTWVRAGSPVSLAGSAWTRFQAPPGPSSANLNSRLFDLSSSGRVEHWKVAWGDFEASPVRGSGAGTFAASWALHRPQPGKVLDAHSLYLETLGELGVIGLALLVGVLAVPAVAAARARRSPVFPAAVGAGAAFTIHAAGDWDWELPGVTIVALLAGAALLASARGGAAAISQPSRSTVLLAPFAVAGAVLAIVSVLGAVPLGRSRDAVDASRWQAAESEALSARRWAPWSSEPLRLLGEARLGQGDFSGARAGFRLALEKDPDSWALWVGLALSSKGPERHAALERARALNPLSPEVRQLLGD